MNFNKNKSMETEKQVNQVNQMEPEDEPPPNHTSLSNILYNKLCNVVYGFEKDIRVTAFGSISNMRSCMARRPTAIYRFR